MQGSDRLQLCGAGGKVGNVGCISVRFGFADGMRVVSCRVVVSCLFLEA